MSESAARDFIARVEHDEAFAGQLDALKDNPESVLARVRNEGFAVTRSEIREALLEQYGAELNPEQLDAIAAGADYTGVMVAGGLGVGTAVGLTVLVASSAAAAP